MPKHHDAHAHQLQGKVLAFNISPKGHIEGVLLKTPSGPAQVNFPKHGDDGRAAQMKPGANVSLKARLESEDEAHPVYELCDADGEVTGTVARLNYARHGEVNGFHLEDGTFIHLKPEGAKKYGVRVGSRVKAVGERRTGPAAVVLEAREIKKLKGTASAGSASARG